jgi:plastocyanin
MTTDRLRLGRPDDRIRPATVDSGDPTGSLPPGHAAPGANPQPTLFPEVLLKMRRLTIALAVLAATAAIAACSASAPPGWTYAPAPSATPIPSGASGSPAASSSAAPSVAPSAAPSVEPSSGASPSAGASGAAGDTVTITAPVGASTAGFDPTTVEAKASSPFSLVFDNQDTGVMHNLVLSNPDGSPVAVTGDTAFFAGPGQRTYGVPALAAGDYKFVCQVHPGTMTGTLTAK